ncbi:hypothetical protein [Rheinheimera sp. EpRS3]|uniref:hypothetical protein n=1 Tax=Rheinheimera sp. EpRS3 TaxID=1712383 RepID=UPI0018D20FDE|nr:hypothetical protein [Rheinheimera sp. EpRS3]
METENKFKSFIASKPGTNFWLLFKVASYDRLVQMQKGLIYMNSLEYFSSLKDEGTLALRADELEKVYGILRAGKTPTGHTTLSLKVDDEEIDMGPEAVLTAHFPRAKNTMLFCMGAFSDGEDGLIPGEVDNKIYFDERFLEFGSHILLINKPRDFSERINKALKKVSGAFSSKLLHDGYGLVGYKSLENYSGPIGLYLKDTKYSWQMEFRISFGVEDHCLNSKGAFELEIGDISDISSIIPVQALIDEPLCVKRRTFIKSGDGYEQVNG